VPSRQHDRVPIAMRVEYRTASSFLVAYSVNLSRGGVFIETADLPAIGAPISIQFAVPAGEPIAVAGRVAWHRAEPTNEGPIGIGIEFEDMVESLGALIDRLVHDFAGLNVLLLCRDRQDRSSLVRMIKSILSAAEVVEAEDPRVATELLGEDIDIAVIDADSDPAGALEAVAAARRSSPRLPTVILAASKNIRDQARAAGADEVTGNPPAFPELRLLLIRALGRPTSVEPA
jgi:uncharacterized protein (TIGR02266 family)